MNKYLREQSFTAEYINGGKIEVKIAPPPVGCKEPLDILQLIIHQPEQEQVHGWALRPDEALAISTLITEAIQYLHMSNAIAVTKKFKGKKVQRKRRNK